MSSKEIAKLTGKAHTHVIRDIRVIIKELGDEPNLVHVVEAKDSRGYTKEFRLQRRETDILLTGYSVALRAKVIDRWRELEAQVAKPAPVNLGDAAALRGLLIGYTEQVIKLEQKVAEDKPKVEYHDAVKASVESLTMLQVANKYGIGRTKLFKFLKDYGVIRNDEHNPPYQRYVDSGHFEVDPKFYKDKGKFVHYTQTKVTGKGDIYIGKLLRKAGLVGSGE
jgi:phage antirepressor YoqD-like protein